MRNSQDGDPSSSYPQSRHPRRGMLQFWLRMRNIALEALELVSGVDCPKIKYLHTY